MSKIINNSGHGEYSSLPRELDFYNFGACFLTLFWAAAHKFYGLMTFYIVVHFWFFFYMPILLFITTSESRHTVGVINVILLIATIITSLITGAIANEYAWKHIRWKSVEDFQKTQKGWRIAGFALSASWLVSLVILVFFICWLVHYIGNSGLKNMG